VISGTDPNHYKFTGKERDSESNLDYFGKRHYGSTLGRFVQADPLFLELSRSKNPQRLNLYTYTINNPLKFIDPNGMEIEVHGKKKKAYLKALQANLPFQIKLSNGVVQTKGKVDASNLTGRQQVLYNAIKDTSHTVNIHAVGQDTHVDFGRQDMRVGGAPGEHTIAFDQAALLDSPKNAGGMNSADLVGHETTEAYGETFGLSGNTSHGYANQFFGGFEAATGGHPDFDNGGDMLGATLNMPVHGSSVVEQIQFRFETPIPAQSIQNGTAQPQIGYPTDVERVH